MNKNDLRNGMMVVTNNNDHFLFTDSFFNFYGGSFLIADWGWVELYHYDEELAFEQNKNLPLSVKEIYSADGPYSIYEFFEGEYYSWTLLWQRPFEVEAEVGYDSK